MFSWMRTRLGVLRIARNPLIVHSRLQHDRTGMIRAQKVRFLRPRPSMKYVFGSAAAFYLIYTYSSNSIFKAIDRLDDALEEVIVEEEAQELREGVNDPAFFPFPLTIREVCPPPYTGFDPEFKQFRKMAADQALLKKLTDDAPQFAAKMILQNNASIRQFTIRNARGMAQCRFPRTPPKYFVQSGIEVGDDFIAWSEMEIDPETALRIQRVTYPKVAMQSFWNWCRVLFAADPNEKSGKILDEMEQQPFRPPADKKLIERVGLEQARKFKLIPDDNVEATRKKGEAAALKIVQEHEKAIMEKIKPFETEQSHEKEGESQIAARDATRNSSNTQEDELRKLNRALKEWREQIPIVNNFAQAIVQRMHFADITRRLTLVKQRKPLVLPEPRGSVPIEGVFALDLELPGSKYRKGFPAGTVIKGFVVIHAQMWYDPIAKKFDESSFDSNILMQEFKPVRQPSKT